MIPNYIRSYTRIRQKIRRPSERLFIATVHPNSDAWILGNSRDKPASCWTWKLSLQLQWGN